MKQLPTLPNPIDDVDRIALYGPMCAGKTFCADYLSKQYGYKKFSLAKRLKEIVHMMYGPVSKDGAGRKLYQDIGQAFRQHDPNCWTKAMLEDINDALLSSLSGPYTKIVVDDVRYVNEAELLQRAGFFLVRVDTDKSILLERFKSLYPTVDYYGASAHGSEQEFDMIQGDFLVNGNTEKVTDILDVIARSINRPF